MGIAIEWHKSKKMAQTHRNIPMLKALLFDLDGTLANTDPLHLQVWQDLLRPWGFEVTQDFYQHHISGRLNADILADLLPQLSQSEVENFSSEKEQLFRQLAADRLIPTAGVINILDFADTQGWKSAVVTNAPRENAEFMLATLNLTQRFQTLVIGEDLAQAKPHPLPYLTALQQLEVFPEQALAFEDSVTGTKSAVAAGLFTIGVTSTHDAQILTRAGAKAVIADFSDDTLRQFGLLV